MTDTPRDPLAAAMEEAARIADHDSIDDGPAFARGIRYVLSHLDATRPNGDHIPWITVTLDDHSLACDCGWRERRNGPTWAEHIHATRPSGDEALLLAVEEVDNAWHDEGDHVEYHEELAERLITLRDKYAALATSASSPTPGTALAAAPTPHPITTTDGIETTMRSFGLMDADAGEHTLADIAEAIAAEGDGVTTDCTQDGVHDHPFRGPHRFTEWYGAALAPAPTSDAGHGHFDADCATCHQLALDAALAHVNAALAAAPTPPDEPETWPAIGFRRP